MQTLRPPNWGRRPLETGLAHLGPLCSLRLAPLARQRRQSAGETKLIDCRPCKSAQRQCSSLSPVLVSGQQPEATCKPEQRVASPFGPISVAQKLVPNGPLSGSQSAGQTLISMSSFGALIWIVSSGQLWRSCNCGELARTRPTCQLPGQVLAQIWLASRADRLGFRANGSLQSRIDRRPTRAPRSAPQRSTKRHKGRPRA